MPEIVVITSLRALPGKEDAVRQALSSLVAPTHAEHGCLLYALHEAATDPGRFALVERWESQEQLDAHARSPHEAVVLELATTLLAEPFDSANYTPLRLGEHRKGSLAGSAAR